MRDFIETVYEYPGTTTLLFLAILSIIGKIKEKQQKVMNKEEAKDTLIGVLMNQVIDLSMMSKIELGDDVIEEIKRLQEIINQNKNK